MCDVSKCNCEIQMYSFEQDRASPASVRKHYVITNGSNFGPPHISSATSERPSDQPDVKLDYILLGSTTEIRLSN